MATLTLSTGPVLAEETPPLPTRWQDMTPSIRRPHRHSTCRIAMSLPFVDTLEIPLIRKYLFYFLFSPIYRKITLLCSCSHLPLLLIYSSSHLHRRVAFGLSFMAIATVSHWFSLFYKIVTWTLSSKTHTHTHESSWHLRECMVYGNMNPNFKTKFDSYFNVFPLYKNDISDN